MSERRFPETERRLVEAYRREAAAFKALAAAQRRGEQCGMFDQELADAKNAVRVLELSLESAHRTGRAPAYWASDMFGAGSPTAAARRSGFMSRAADALRRMFGAGL